MSLNIQKAKTINNLFTKLSKTKKMIHGEGYQSKLKEMQRDFNKKENVLDYLKSFLTQRKPYLIKVNNFLIKEPNNKNYLSTLPTKYELKTPSNLKSRGISDLNSKIKIRNSYKINQINSMRYKDNSKNYFYRKNNYKNYSHKINGFTPRNRYKLMKIYHSLHMLSPCLTKPEVEKDFTNVEINGENNNNINKELNIDSNNNKLKSNKTSNIIIDKKDKKEINYYKIQNVNSFQLLNKKKDVRINNYIKQTNNTEEEELKEKIINGDSPKNYLEYLKIQKIKNVLKNNEPKLINLHKKNDVDIELDNNYEKIGYDNIDKKLFEINDNKNEYQGEKEALDLYNKYNKMNIMGSCLNKLFFDYSDGNYSSPTNHNYLKEEHQNNNIIINKEIISKENNIKKAEQRIPISIRNEIISANNKEEERLIKSNSDKKKEKINKNNINKLMISNELNKNDFIENKENINTENIKTPKNQVLSLNSQSIDNRNRINIINDNSNNKIMKEIIQEKNKSHLKEMDKINLNLNYLSENKNFINIQLLSDVNRSNKNNHKKIIPPTNNFYRHSRLMKSPQSNLAVLLERIPRHEKFLDENSFYRSHSVKNKTINNQNLRRNKIIEYISKKSAIMPPNDYTFSNQLVSYYS